MDTRFKEIVRPNVSEEDILQVYEKWAPTYDTDLIGKLQCGNYSLVAEKCGEFYPESERCSVKILDAGAGTGLVGQALYDNRFVHVDALDPSKDMLEVARARGVYEHIYQEYLTEKPLSIKQDTYDAVVGIGMLGHKHAPFSSMHEMIRLVKPGGYIILAIRRWYMQEDDGYHALEPMMADIESAGKWKKVIQSVYPNFYTDSEGLLYIFQVL